MLMLILLVPQIYLLHDPVHFDNVFFYLFLEACLPFETFTYKGGPKFGSPLKFSVAVVIFEKLLTRISLLFP